MEKVRWRQEKVLDFPNKSKAASTEEANLIYYQLKCVVD